MKKLGFMLAFFILLVALILPACAKTTDQDVIRVAIVGPMQFMQGEHHWMGATMAADEINKAGGVNIGGKKYTIKLIKVDSNEILDVAGAASAVERAITVDKADLIMGGFRTEAVFPMSDVAMDNKKLFFNCGAATAALQQRVADDYNRYKYFFKSTPYNETFLVTSDFKMMAMVAAVLKEQLGIQKPKVAAIIEKLEWTQKMVLATKVRLPQMGFDLVGVWQPSDTATDVTAELTAIAKAEPHMIFTLFSGPVGVTYAKQRGELKIPAVSVGIIVEGQKKGFWEATGGKGNYEIVLNTYAKGVSITPKSIPFFDEFEKRTGQFPTYTAATYDALHSAKLNMEQAQTLDPDALVPFIEKMVFESTAGIVAYYPMGSTPSPPKCPHDLVYGPGRLTGVGTQWIDGELKCVWPKKEYGTVDDYGDWKIEYPGTIPFKIAPEVLAKFKKSILKTH
jgi:branched-chain amino acid transport system substrate-binding protein